MSVSSEFSFGSGSVAGAYDDVLVPILFRPWADDLVSARGDWAGRRVLDLATGTGIVARLLAERVGPSGKVMASDINAEMLALARKRCQDAPAGVDFIESPAHPLEIADECVDDVVCQQGFQFFPDRAAAAREVLRILRPGGQVVASTWLPVRECHFFGAICEALSHVDEPEIADMMRIPFDFIDADELESHFSAAGFTDVGVERHVRPLPIDGGIPQAVQTAYATPIGPRLKELPEPTQAGFRSAMSDCLRSLCSDGVTMGSMASNVLSARKAG